MSFETAQFKPGQGGRVKGARNKLSMSFVTALAKEFEEFGAEAIRIARIERPTEFIKIIAHRSLPKEFEIVDLRLQDITDEELNAFIEYAQRQLAGSTARIIEGGKEPTPDREPVKLLLPLTPAKSSFMRQAQRIASGCCSRGISSVKRWPVVSKSPCTPRVNIPSGGKANASTGRPWAGRRVLPAKS